MLAEGAERRQLATDEGDQPRMLRPVVLDDVLARDGALGTIRFVGQRPNARVSESDGVAGEVRLGENQIGLVDDVVDLFIVGHGAIEVAREPLIGAADQVTTEPRDDEGLATVGACFVVHALVNRAALEGVDHEVGPLGSAIEPGLPHRAASQHGVDPRSGRIHGDCGPDVVALARLAVENDRTGNPIALGQQRLDLAVVQRRGAGRFGSEHEFNAESLGVGDLRVVVDTRALQVGAHDSGLSLDGLSSREDAVVGHRLSGREDVVHQHPHLEEKLRVLIGGIERHDESERLDEVGYCA